MAISITELKKRSVRGVVSYTLRTGFLYLVGIIATGILGVYLSPGPELFRRRFRFFLN